MGYLAKIIVQPGKTFTITDIPLKTSHLYACTDMWDGIYMNNSSALVVISNGSTIEDALNALGSENLANYQIAGNVIHGNVIFNKNFRNIVVKNALASAHPGYVRSTTFQCYDGVVGGNPVNTANKLHYPHTGQRTSVGIDITDAFGVTVGNATLLNYLNTFDNMDFGIRSVNASVYVWNNDFKNISTSTPPAIKDECTPGTAICSKGLNIFTPRSLTVADPFVGPFYKNTFTNCTKGVTASRFLKIVIWRNVFTNTNFAIRASTNTLRSINITENIINNSITAIDCFNNLGATVNINKNNINAGGITNAQGILANEITAGPAIFNIRRNTILNVRKGIVGNGLKNAAIYDNDVIITHTSSATLPCYGIRLTNSNNCKVIANWIKGTNRADYWVSGISLDICYSNYITCNQSHDVGSGLWFGGVQTPNTYIAKNLMDNNYRGFTLNYGEVGPQKTGSGSSTQPNDNRWTGTFDYHTYSFNSPGTLSPIYVRNPTGPYNPATYLFYTATPFDDIHLIPIPGNLNSLVCPVIIFPTGVSPLLALLQKIAGDSITPAAYDLSTRWMLKQSLYQYLKTDSAMLATQPMLANFQSTNATSNIGKLDDVEKVITDPVIATPAALLTAKSLNNTVLPANDAETNNKWINEVLIDNALSGSNFNDAQLADFRILASKCPYNDGMAVHQARTILSQFEDVEYINPCEVYLGESRSMTTTTTIDEEETEFRLFPNPNDGSMNLIYSMNEKSQGEMKIYDVTGKIVATYRLEIGVNNQILVNETQLKNGIYFYKVIIDNELKASDKIVIIK